MTDEKDVPAAPPEGEAPAAAERFHISVTHKGETRTYEADSFMLATTMFSGENAGQTRAFTRGLRTADAMQDVAVILNLGQACIEVAARTASEIAKRNGIQIAAGPDMPPGMLPDLPRAPRSSGKAN